jgi:hypothetical protein
LRAAPLPRVCRRGDLNPPHLAPARGSQVAATCCNVCLQARGCRSCVLRVGGACVNRALHSASPAAAALDKSGFRVFRAPGVCAQSGRLAVARGRAACKVVRLGRKEETQKRRAKAANGRSFGFA